MERLTHPRNSGIKTGYWSPNKKDELIERLAAYEDTDLTPQEIYSLKAGTILKALRTEWIPVKERLPEKDDFVLVTVSGTYNHLTFSDALQLASYTEDDGWFIESYPEWDDPNVIAWMPLPEPYQWEKNNE